MVLLILNTELFSDLNTTDSRVKTMACCCFGYFLYDSFALIKHLGVIRAYDILIHHAIVFCEYFCFELCQPISQSTSTSCATKMHLLGVFALG